jgi:hypothetical protein
VPSEGVRSQAVRVKEWLERNADEDWTVAQVAEVLAIPVSSAAVCLGYLAPYRPECSVVRRGVYRWSPLDDAYDRRLAARDHAVRIVRLLD